MENKDNLREIDYDIGPRSPKLFIFFSDMIAWLQIFASPFLIGLLLGFVAYISLNDRLAIVVALSLAFAGLVIGVIWATRVQRRRGASNHMSRIMSTPDIDGSGTE